MTHHIPICGFPAATAHEECKMMAVIIRTLFDHPPRRARGFHAA